VDGKRIGDRKRMGDRQIMDQHQATVAPGATASPLGLQTISPDRLFALGSAFEIDGRVSWLPAEAHGFQATRSYLVKQDEHYLLVDPGLRYQRDLLLRQLAAVVPHSGKISVYLSRSEPDCFGCLEDLLSDYDVERVITGGGHNPFDGFDGIAISSAEAKGKFVPVSRAGKATPIELTPDRKLIILSSVLRVNATFWLYDPASEALMTSDAFCHSLGDSYEEALELDSEGDASVEEVRAHLFGKFWWMPFAHREEIATQFREVFETYRVKAICPGHGRPFVGEAAVNRVVDLMERALLEGNKPRPLN
jgi:flavorubredoxin